MNAKFGNHGCLASVRIQLLMLSVFVLTGCTTIPTPDERNSKSERLVSGYGWDSTVVHTEQFKIRSFVEKNPERHQKLTIYIEGDGLAWKTRTEVSQDPTPTNLMWLRVALAHTPGNAAYLARPCQFIKDLNRHCDPSVWTGARFSQSVVVSMNQAIDELKGIYGANYIELVGFSGGGAVATLVAAYRDDVERLITVAGTLDHRKWTEYHNVTPLSASLNPPDYWESLQDVPQFHFIGGRDSTVPKSVSEAYISRFPIHKMPELMVVEEFDHACCWETKWHQLYSTLSE